jgi:hypothetical protein
MNNPSSRLQVVPEPATDDNGDKIPLTPDELTIYREGEPNIPLDTLPEDDASRAASSTADDPTTDTATSATENDEAEVAVHEAEPTETPVEDHPLIDPVVSTITAQTTVSQQRATETTARFLSAFAAPTYPAVVTAVATDLGVADTLDREMRADNETGDGEILSDETIDNAAALFNRTND